MSFFKMIHLPFPQLTPQNCRQPGATNIELIRVFKLTCYAILGVHHI